MTQDNEEPSAASAGSLHQFWLITVAQEDCEGFQTIPIRQHPADYVFENERDALVFAIPISKKQFSKAVGRYENGH